jgi:hypothetical protein
MRYEKHLSTVLFFFCFCVIAGAREISLSSQEMQWIGDKVFENECASKDKYMVVWNAGEDFLSVGIAHFIWYPANRKGPFEESFAGYLEYAKASGEKIPRWLDTKPFPACPWDSREQFLNDQSNPDLQELREFLEATKPVQSAFIVKRLNDALPLMLANVPEGSRDKISHQFNRVASMSSGAYALADYVNFKGLGTAPSESYGGKGWGLLQVLAEMKDNGEDPDALKEFVRSASKILATRVKNAPLERNEHKWLPGWQKRVDSYLKQ